MSAPSPQQKLLYQLEWLGLEEENGSRAAVIDRKITIGRSEDCSIHIPARFTSVSRVHASITYRKHRCWLHHRSKSQSTLINGNPVAKKVLLHPNDIIQLGDRGPRFRFHRNLAGRENTGHQRSLTSVVLSVLLVIAVACCIYCWERVSAMDEQLNTVQQENRVNADSLRKLTRRYRALKTDVQSDQMLSSMNLRADQQLLKEQQAALNRARRELENQQTEYEVLQQVKHHVFEVQINDVKAQLDGRRVRGVTLPEPCLCTGILMPDGRLITPRHCLEPYYYVKSELNLLASQGAELEVSYTARSLSGNRQFRFTNHDLKTAVKPERYVSDTYNGYAVKRKLAIPNNLTDWATVISPFPGNMLPGKLKEGVNRIQLIRLQANSQQPGQASLQLRYEPKNNKTIKGMHENNLTSSGVAFTIENGQAFALGLYNSKQNGEYHLLPLSKILNRLNPK